MGQPKFKRVHDGSSDCTSVPGNYFTIPSFTPRNVENVVPFPPNKMKKLRSGIIYLFFMFSCVWLCKVVNSR